MVALSDQGVSQMHPAGGDPSSFCISKTFNPCPLYPFEPMACFSLPQTESHSSNHPADILAPALAFIENDLPERVGHSSCSSRTLYLPQGY